MTGGGPDPRSVSTRDELATGLTELRRAAGLTVRELAGRLGAPSGTLGDYFSGRHLPSAAQLPTLAAALRECGVEDDAEIHAWLDAVRRARIGSDRRVSRPPAPYRGLNCFQPEDAELYFGRSAETREILDRIAGLDSDPGPSGGVLAVVGPSGSGKSSLLRAGVAAAIGAGALDTPGHRWTVTVTTPTGADLPDALGRGGPRVVLVDQFEELFTSVDEPEERQRLLRLLGQRPARVVVVLGMRADFYAAAAREPFVLGALQHAQVVVGPMGPAEVRAAILAPAEANGGTVEDGLADLVLTDLAPRDASGPAYDAGALPLLAHALLATWDRSNGRRMTIADYRATGGIDAAVKQTAEDLYSALDPAERTVARRLFLRLVNIDDVAVTRRRVALDELRRLAADGVDVQGVLERFVEHRLVSTSGTSIQVSHEALLSAWPRLRAWVDADRAGLRVHRQLTDAAGLWDGAGRDPGLLLRGARLETAVHWMADGTHRDELDELERSFVDQAVRQARADEAHERGRVRRFGGLLAAVGVLALVVSALVAYSVGTRASAHREARTARAARADALSRQVAIDSDQIERTDPALAQQLALVAYDTSPTPEARSAVIDRSARPVMSRRLGGQGPTPLAVSPNGHTIAVGDAGDGSVHLYTAEGSRPPRRSGVLPGAKGPAHVFALAFSPNGRILATGGMEHAVRLWDVSSPAHPRAVAVVPTTFTGATQSIAISPDGSTLVAGSVGRDPVLEWNIADPSTPLLRPGPLGLHRGTTIRSVTFDASGSLLSAGGTSGVYVWPAASAASTRPRTVRTPSKAGVDTLLFDRAGSRLYVGDRAGLITTWDVRGKQLRLAKQVKIGTDALINVLALSPDGRQLTAGSSDNDVRQWATSTSRLISTTGLPGPVTGVGYCADGARLLTTAADGTLREWQAAQSTIPISGTAFTVGYAANKPRLEVGTSGTGGVLRVWDTSDPSAPRPVTPPIASPLPVVSGTGAIRPDAKLVAASNEHGEIALWDVSDPAHPRATATFTGSSDLPEQLAFSPDGRLLAVASNDHTLCLWDVRDPAHPHRLAGVMSGRDLMLNVAFSRDGRFVAGANADSRVYVWDIRHPARPRRVAALTGFDNYAYGVAFSPDGTLLAAASADHTTRLWRMAGDAAPTPFGRPLRGPTNYVYSVAFSADSRSLAIASDDATVRLYNLRARAHTQPSATLRELGGNVYAVAFSPNGQTVVAGGRPGVLDLWTVDAAAVARTVCAAAGDSITRAEWKQYLPGTAYSPPCRNGRPTH